MMADENFNQKEECPETSPAAFLLLNRNPSTGESPNAVLKIHPETMILLSEAAEIAGESIIDFVFDSAWMRIKQVIRQHEETNKPGANTDLRNRLRLAVWM